jgi:hypothetical protein
MIAIGRDFLALVAILCAAPSMAQSVLSLADAREIIIAQRSRLWKDPYSIRDGRISAPHTCPSHALLTQRDKSGLVCVCVEANAKNSYGGYTGLQKTRLLFRGREIVDMHGPLFTGAKATPDGCGSFQPFPEINGR